MIKTILSIAGKPGLYKLVSRGNNMLIVESLTTGRRTPAYSRDKVVSLGDISIYTNEGDEPLSVIFETIKEKSGGQAVDVKSLSDAEVRAAFQEILPDFDDERVYTNDIRKVYAWYNQLIAAGVAEFAEADQEEAEEVAE